MAVSYKKLFKILIDRDMKKKTFCKKAKVSQGTISRTAEDNIVGITPDEED